MKTIKRGVTRLVKRYNKNATIPTMTRPTKSLVVEVQRGDKGARAEVWTLAEPPSRSCPWDWICLLRRRLEPGLPTAATSLPVGEGMFGEMVLRQSSQLTLRMQKI